MCCKKTFAINYSEGIFVGYRWYEAKKKPVNFPFGFGLSYTTFEFGKLSTDKKTYAPCDTIRLSLTLKNTGIVDGAEVVQLYVTQKNPSVLRPVKELKAFQKIFLKAGETQTTDLEIVAKDLAFYDETRHDWKLESGSYMIHSAASATDLKGRVEISLRD